MIDRDALQQPVTRRRFVQLVGATTGAASLAGVATTTQFARVLAQDATGGELIVAATQDGYRTEPNRATIGMYPANTNVFESLVRLTFDYQVEPLLAESWELVEPNTFRFTLRQGVTFHDGTPFTAEAVQWSMHRIALAGGGVIGVDEDSTQVIDDFTVEITPIRPNHQLVQQLVHPVYSIVAPDSEPADVRIGTGPFKEVEYAREDRYVVEANDDYWGEAPKLSRITFRFMPDATTRMLALQAGEVDLIYEVPKESAQQLEELGDFALVTSQVGAYHALYVNIHGEEPYDLGRDRTIREALAYAIDKDAIVSGVWQGNAEPGKTMIPPAILGPAGDSIEATTFDPERANQLLDEAGWVLGDNGVRSKDGRELRLTMIVGFPSAEIHAPMPEFVQAQLSDVGIELDLVQTPDTATYEARLATGEGDLWAEAGSQNDGNPCFLPDLLFYTPDPEGDPEAAMYGNAFAPGAAFDAFIDQCRSATSIEEVQEAAAGGMKVLIDEEFIVIPLAGTFRLFGVAANVEGFEAHPSGVNQRWTDVSVEG